MYGGHRLGNNLFSDTLVCVKCATGERVWHYQIVHHDLWDYDLPAAPILADITVDGRRSRPSSSSPSRRSHSSSIARPESRCGRSKSGPCRRPIRRASARRATQPFPTKPPPFDRQGVTVDDLIDFTPELRERSARARRSSTSIGPLFTPPSLRADGPGGTKGTVQLPGSVGGADWQGARVRSRHGRCSTCTSITGPFVADLVKGDPKRTDLDYVPGLRAYPPGPQGLPLLKPPYGRITAIDLNKGEHRVDGRQRRRSAQSSAAEAAEPAAARQSRPRLACSRPGRCSLSARATRSWCARAGASARDAALDRARRGRQQVPRVRQGDRRRALGNRLPAGTTGAPMTYMFEGKQYIIVPIGGADHDPEWVALSLP